MSKRLCVCGLLLVLLMGGTPLLAQPPQADEPGETASWWTTLLSDWLDGLLSVVTSGSTGAPGETTEAPQSPPGEPQTLSSFTEEDNATTESGPLIEPGG